MVKVYVPEHKAETLDVPCPAITPGVHKYVYPPFPPDGATVIAPVQILLQRALVITSFERIGDGSLIVTGLK